MCSPFIRPGCSIRGFASFTRKRVRTPVLCFDGEIRQVMNNLVGNAIDAMHPQGGNLFLRGREGRDWRSGRKGVFLTVADTGPGMSAQTQSKSFEAFFTTKGHWRHRAGVVDQPGDCGSPSRQVALPQQSAGGAEWDGVYGVFAFSAGSGLGHRFFAGPAGEAAAEKCAAGRARLQRVKTISLTTDFCREMWEVRRCLSLQPP